MLQLASVALCYYYYYYSFYIIGASVILRTERYVVTLYLARKGKILVGIYDQKYHHYDYYCDL